MTVATRRTLDRTRRRLRGIGLLAFATIVAIVTPSDAVAAPGDGNPVIV